MFTSWQEAIIVLGAEEVFDRADRGDFVEINESGGVCSINEAEEKGYDYHTLDKDELDALLESWQSPWEPPHPATF